MQKFSRTLIASLLLGLPAWSQSMFPPPNSTINQIRPNIGCDWGNGARNLQLFIDGKEWTMASNKNGGRIDINPVFDVGYGSHTVESRAVGILGLPVSRTWTFTIANPNPQPNPTPSPAATGATRLYPLDSSVVNDVRPRISADFPENVRSARGFLDGQEVTNLVGVAGTNVAMTPQTDLARGNHQVSLEIIYQSGARYTQNWTFQVRPNRGNENPSVPQGFTNLSPAQNSQVTISRPMLSADFGVVMDNVRIYVDKNDVTNQAQVTSNRIAWNPTYDLNPGTHFVHVEGRQTNNNQQVQSDWQFNVASNGNWNNGNNGNQNGTNSGGNDVGEVDFGVDTPNPGDKVNATFKVVGSAAPDSNLRVSVKPLPNKNKVAQFTGKADPNGNYNITVSPTWATKGMRLEVTTTVLDQRGRPLADPIVITVIRR
ncbi:MAG: hypothetical protein U0931_18675 [Vulcanimicrobiota bacterium]